ncbi:hypothetical protein M413DRAFT_14097 [Hebeloma cylindrosporum]|uniref:Uncharacterized protein n=1 Tax=Hebeloma cylindrosporum TaxID=76867 RepID=A0A0C3BXV2_HEBCY|nr:hypothetical protein M413DRAFT_14097 [Hebeloma cylindrosporum h7]
MAPQGPPGSYSPQLAGGSRNPPHIEYTKAIAQEVRLLLSEIGRLRDERRQLQYEIAELMAVRTKFGPTGEFQPEWRPPAIEAPPPPPEAPPAIEDAPAPAKPAWRTVHKRPDRKARTVPKITAPPPPMPPPPPEPVREMPSWTQWRPNPLLVPAPAAAPAPMANAPPPRSGLFGI